MAAKTNTMALGEPLEGVPPEGETPTVPESSEGNFASYDVEVELSISKSLGKSGFGIPLILAGKQGTDVPYTECLDLEELSKVFPAGTMVYEAAKLMMAQSTERFKIAVCGTKEKSADKVKILLGKEWRQLIVPTAGQGEDSTVAELSDVVEATDRVYFATVKSTDEVPGKMLNGKPRDRTVCFLHATNPHGAAALVGKISQKRPGTYTYKNQILKELVPESLDDKSIQQAHAAGCICFVRKAGDNVTSEGKAVGGEYIDVIDGQDYVISRIQYESQRVFNRSDRVAFTDNGISQLEDVCVTVMKECYGDGNQIIDTDDEGNPAYTVQYGTRAETSAQERKDRRYRHGRFSFALLNAIHTAKVNGSIVV